jgi:hypothetical protein
LSGRVEKAGDEFGDEFRERLLPITPREWWNAGKLRAATFISSSVGMMTTGFEFSSPFQAFARRRNR